MNHDWSIPSFFKHSYVKGKYVFDECPESFKENIFTDYDTPNYVRIMKRYSYTGTYVIDGQLDKKLFNDESQKTCFLRCYLPKRSIAQSNPNKRIKDVVIMINGLCETTRYDFYDQLGSHFASQNIASILLPTPYHLNRRSNNEVFGDPSNDNIVNPLRMASKDPLRFYFNFKRSIHEIENLCDKIHGNVTDPEDLGFYDAYFARGKGVHIRITLFGFSLGGLRALGSFMKEQETPRTKNKPRYHSCISFNSTADPFQADIEQFNISKKEWNDIKKGVNEAIRDKSIKASSKENKLILRLFEWLYNRSYDEQLVHTLKTESKRFLMVQSAGDKIVTKENDWTITDPEHGLNKIVVAGVNHIVTLDRKWHQYLPSVVKQLLTFIHNANDSSYSHKDIANEIKEIIAENPEFIALSNKYTYKDDIEAMDFTTDRLKKMISHIKNPHLKNKFIELYYQSKTYYPKFPELLSNILDNKKKRKWGLYMTNCKSELKCGAGPGYETIYNLPENHPVQVLSMGGDMWLRVEVNNSAGSGTIIGFIESTNLNPK